MKAFNIGPKGGTIDVVSRDGEISRSFHVGPGVYPLAKFRPFLAPGERLSGPGVVETLGNTVSTKAPGKFESAANPFWTLTAAQKQANELRRMMQRTEALAKRTATMQRAMRRAASAAAQLPAPSAEVPPPSEGAA